LEQLLREGARKLLRAATENEVIDYIQLHKDRVDENGQRLVVRNGHLPEREVIVERAPFQFVSRGSGTGKRGLFQRASPSTCVGFPVWML
jgi:hypothetical protein